jgi:hypothetical protein
MTVAATSHNRRVNFISFARVSFTGAGEGTRMLER